MPQHKINYIGEKYNLLTVIGEGEPYINPKGKKFRRVSCQCECGNIKDVKPTDLKSSRVKSCGCYNKEKVRNRVTTHGDTSSNFKHSRSKEYRSWQAMKIRCTNFNHNKYKDYGGAGIKVCQRWLDDYQNFLDDMGRAPGPEYSIDRIDSKGDYEPSNCRWATPTQQTRNRKATKLNPDLVRYIRQQRALGVKGKYLAQELGVSLTCIYSAANGVRWQDVDASRRVITELQAELEELE